MDPALFSAFRFGLKQFRKYEKQDGADFPETQKWAKRTYEVECEITETMRKDGFNMMAYDTAHVGRRCRGFEF